MNEHTNSTTPQTLNSIIDGAIFRVASGQLTTSNSWDPTVRNFSNRSVSENVETDPSILLITRTAVIACVIVALFILTWGSYTLHKKCVRDSWRQKYHKALLL